MITGAWAVSNPNLAGSPREGTRLNNGTADLLTSTSVGSSIVTIATPNAVSSGHRFLNGGTSVAKSCSLHRGMIVALPTRPAGSSIRASRTNAGGRDRSVVWLNVIVLV